MVWVLIIITIWYFTIKPGRKFSPRIEITDKYLLYKATVFGQPKIVRWEDVNSIKVSNLTLTIGKKDEQTEYFYFEDDGKNTITLMKFAKELANHKSVQYINA